MAWPVLADLKQVLDVTSDDWDTQLARVLASAIAGVKEDVGDWIDGTDEPDDALAAAALIRAELASNTTTDADTLRQRYSLLLKGHRRRFSIA